jgi:hypothetical protein
MFSWCAEEERILSYAGWMRQDPDYFGEQELALIYVAKRLKDALKLEKLLTDVGLDYLVEPDKYSGGVIFRSERVGAFFYVAPENERIARDALTRGGFEPYDLG